ncbi:hypothetical protein BGZ95_006273 [Linnemannia exigua]|uniref:Uncharacterized protein n=1 Tax=Linnemannia exigua TaxID=604196 RepID=A0AAD4DG44_9FUNG|nr:hypothetical protein BGZ95_006273 [Linnemannia exigua]
MSSSGLIDQDQLDGRLTRLIVDHNHFRTLLFRYIRRAVTLCPWQVDQDSSSFYRQFERVDKLTDLLQYIRDYALQSFQNVERQGSALLSQVDALLARPMPPPPPPAAAGSPLNGALSPNNRGPKGLVGINGHPADPNGPNGGPIGVNGTSAGIGAPFNNNRVLYLAGEVKEAIRFWREQCLRVQSIDNLVCELDRISDLRQMTVKRETATIEDKIKSVKMSSDESRMVADKVEPWLDAWLAKLQVADRPREDHGHPIGHGPGYGHHGGSGGTPAHLHHGMSFDHRSLSHPSLGSPAASYSSQQWSQGS